MSRVHKSGGFYSLRKPQKTPSTSSKSKSEFNPLPIYTEGNNKMTQVMIMVETMQARMDENKKIIELMTTTHQTFTRDTSKKDGDKTHNEEIFKVGGDDDKKARRRC